MCPQSGTGTVAHTPALTGKAEILTREAAADHVHRLDPLPVYGCDVAIVRDPRKPVSQYSRGVLIPFAEPDRLRAEDFLDREGQSSVPGKEFS